MRTKPTILRRILSSSLPASRSVAATTKKLEKAAAGWAEYFWRVGRGPDGARLVILPVSDSL